MSKEAVASVAGIGGLGYAAGGVYLSEIFVTLDSSLPETVDKLKTDGAKGCVAHLFPKLSLSTSEDKAISESNKVSSKYFDPKDSSLGSACLTINWERENFSDTNSPWRGSFRWLWSFINKNKGLIMFTAASPSSTEKELTLTGIVYFLKKEGKGTWTIDKYKEINSGKKINKTDWDSVFPKTGDSIKFTLNQRKNLDYWGFLSGKEDLEKLCKTGENSPCKTTSKKSSFKGLWLVHSFDEDKDEVKKWSGNIDSLLETLYTTPDLSIKDALASLKGEWKINSQKHK